MARVEDGDPTACLEVTRENAEVILKVKIPGTENWIICPMTPGEALEIGEDLFAQARLCAALIN